MGAGSSSLPPDQDHNTWSIEPPTADNRSLVPSGSPGVCADKETCEIPRGMQQSEVRTSESPGWGSNAGLLFGAKAMKTYPDGMELTRTITHLAAANQQLAEAHNLTLNHLQWLLADKRAKTKSSCVHCRSKDAEAKCKTRLVLGKPKVTTNRRLRRLRKMSTLDENLSIYENSEENSKTQEIINELRREIEDLNVFKKESQTKNDRLMNDLEGQRLVIERLTQDFENSQRECERKERSLEQVSQELNRSEFESARLLAELKTFQCERQETEETRMLRERLAEQDEESRKQLQALEEATQQIRALELTIQANNQSTKTNTEAASNLDESSQTSTNASVEEFKKELMLKREARQRAIAAISSEMDRLRRELETEKIAHSETTKLLEDLKEAQAKSASESKTDDNDNLETKTDKKTSKCAEALRLNDLLKISDEITSNLLVQLERTDDLRFQLENNPNEHRMRIHKLKLLADETRTVVCSRKRQVDVLKDRLAQILVRLGSRCFLDESDEIREEVERQIEDIARSRNLSDERSRMLVELKEHCYREMHELKFQLDNAKKDKQSLEEDLSKTEDKMDAQDAEILNLESQLGLAKADCRELENQMSVINSLFTQMLLSASSAEMDLDRLTRLLQENHDLISDMAKENGTEAAALPKLLLDIIEQVDGRARESEEKKEEDDLQEESIANNLPKVWRVLLELLSCHAAGSGTGSSSATAESAPDSCYKSVDTPTGPRLVISVSKTYIRLKELILEKKHLEKEMNRMKQLNTHLESKLSEQEKRLSTVSDELSKTWNIVGRMEAQHQQLHTHEKILRYELQQKRIMLQELKQELEYCKEKWESARQKNTNTEIEWRSLRREFAARKALVTHTDSFNVSGESGFSDEREEESDEDEDEGDVGKRIRPINSRRRSRKDDSRAKTPDTESEQPTDNELSESKTVSTSTSGPRTPTPETEPELENPEVMQKDLTQTTPVLVNAQNSNEEVLDPLEKALTTVIENLIETDDSECPEVLRDSESENAKVDSTVPKVSNEIVMKEECVTVKTLTEISLINQSEQKIQSNENTVNVNSETVSPIYSVFTIGPILSQVGIAQNVQFGNSLEVNFSNITSENSSELNTNTSTSSMTAKKEKIVSLVSSEVDNISINSSSSLETVKEVLHHQNDQSASSLSNVSTSSDAEMEVKVSEEPACSTRRLNDLTSTEVLDARAARLRNLEEQAEWLIKKMSNTNRRGSALSSRLEALHETFGSTPAAPPMPDVLPTFRLQCEINERSLDSGDREISIQKNNNEERSHSDDTP